MEILNVLIVEDQLLCIDNLKQYLKDNNSINLVGTCNNSFETIKFLRENIVDLIFLDIQLGKESGFDLANYINQYYSSVFIIFVTAFDSFAIEGYEYKPLSFLTKPINGLKLEKAINEALAVKYKKKENKDVKIGLHVNGGLELININEILYVEKVHRKVYIVCHKGKKYEANDSLKSLEIIFSNYGFYRCHQSFLVSVNKITSIYHDAISHSYNLKLKDITKEIPLSRNNYSSLKRNLIDNGINIINR